MSMSETIRMLVRDATIGMSDAEVQRQTGLKFATWRKFKDGVQFTEKTILTFCAALDIDATPFLAERQRVIGEPVNSDKIIAAAIGLLELAQWRKRELIACYRKLRAEEVDDRRQAASA